MKMRPAIACLAVLALAACGHMPDIPDWGNLTGGAKSDSEGYKPLSSEVAAIAVPQQGTGGPGGVFCRVSKGSALFGGRWLDFRTTDFSLPPDMRVTVSLAPARGEGEMLFQSWFSAKTQEMLFCPVVDGPPDKKIPCASIYALDEDLDVGIKRTFDIPGTVEGGVLACAHSPDKLKK